MLTVDFTTHSRRDVMKVCSLLAKGIGEKILTDKRINITINGSVQNGKSAIVDGLTAAFADNHCPYGLSSEPLIENYPAEATDKKSHKMRPAQI